jgi:hypothetical protein
MKLFLFSLVIVIFSSCFLFGKFKKNRISFEENGVSKSYQVLIPKGFKTTKKKTDTAGNEAQFYYYADGAVLYFAKARDTTVQYQVINYDENLPRELYNTIFFKGVDDDYEHYWRETRFGIYKIGYLHVDEGEDWKFDSAINYFTLRSVKPVQ